MNKKDAIELLNKTLKELNEFSAYDGENDITDFKLWEKRTDRNLKKIFGENSSYVESFAYIIFEYIPSNYDFGYSNSDFVSTFINARKEAVIVIRSAIEEIEDTWEENISKTYQTSRTDNVKITIVNNKINTAKTKVFIVHGHDELAISQVSEIIRKLKLEPIVLKDQVSRSSTVIEKIEANTNDIGFGVVLYTECDIGGKDKDSLKSRARQNVVLEHGYLMAKIGRENTFALVKGKVETPGDISGVVYTQMDDHKAWSFTLAKELKASGFDIDLNNLA